ncbi:hypothetical protein GUJ93_ZPchr0001g31504 [Zizania palustris]|uniref:Phospholipase A1 n=1 Tax=Zizania palustris TaxID=103762 RepID=A0A8J5RBR7_ZIZPA|nr:hypothetical protein GUJ93_ZPchr0001g31504 [Zizania palustris]
MSTDAAPIRSIAERWRELHGEDQWRGLLDPLDGDLRRSIICYGELEQATNDAFIREAWSPHAGACRYSRDRFLDKAGAWGPAGLYEVTAFFYATAGAGGVPGLMMARPPAAGGWAWSRESNWMGYVAVATDAGVAAVGRRDVVVAWRGTAVRPMEWLNDLDFTLVSAAGVLGVGGDHRPAPRVHRGWLSIYTATDPASKYSKLSAREQILDEIKRLMDKYKDEDTSITVVGHSLGAAVATLNAADIVSNGLNLQGGDDGPNRRASPVTAVAFACPRVGDAGFKKLFDELPGLRLLRVCNAPDVVPIYPPMGYVRGRRRPAAGRHGEVSVPQVAGEPGGVAQPRVLPARRRRRAGHAHARRVQAGGRPGRGACEQERGRSQGGVPCAAGVERAKQQGHGEGRRWPLEVDGSRGRRRKLPQQLTPGDVVKLTCPFLTSFLFLVYSVKCTREVAAKIKKNKDVF